ncbi:carbon-monoxide dehydrogenase medium subunit [Bradyrhizobium sp. USDA 4341]
MISQQFEYRAPREIDEALDILERADGACAVLGGGTWLIPNMTFAVHQPKVVLDPRHLDFASIHERDDEVLVGARVTYSDALRSSVVSAHLPLLAAMATGITGGISIVGQGTMGGSACYANPSSDFPACLVALRGRLRLRSARETREVDAANFFKGAFATARRPDEMLEGIIFPKRPSSARWGYQKLKFSTGSWPIVTAAAVVEGERARVVLGAATSVPVLSEAILPANAGDDELRALATSCASVSPEAELSDELAGPGYRRRVANAIVLRALKQCGLPQ